MCGRWRVAGRWALSLAEGGGEEEVKVMEGSLCGGGAEV